MTDLLNCKPLVNQGLTKAEHVTHLHLISFLSFLWGTGQSSQGGADCHFSGDWFVPAGERELSDGYDT